MNLEGRNLQINMRGDDVRRLQTELNQLGFNLGVNGFFDSMTLVVVEQFQKKHGLTINGVVDEKTARRINAEVDALDEPPFIVKGHIYQADGDPAADVLISAFDVDLRSEQLLGETQTDRKGFYQIQYSAEQFSKQEKGKADLVVKVLSTNDVVLVASPISFNAPTLAEIDLTIPAKALGPLPLFDKIRQELAPLLENLRAEDLEDARIQSTEKQIKFARLFNQYRALTPELLEELRQDSSFTPTEIADLDTSFQLADLTRGDFSVVKMLKQEFSVRQPEQIRTLATLGLREIAK